MNPLWIGYYGLPALCVHLCGINREPEVSVRSLCQLLSILLFRSFSLTESKAHHLARMAGQWTAGTHPSLSFQHWDYRCMHSYSAVSWWWGGQNPGPHACAANSSPTEDLPSPCTPYSLMGSDKIYIIIEACGSLGPQTPGRETCRLRLCGPSPSSLILSPPNKTWKSLRYAILIFQMWRSFMVLMSQRNAHCCIFKLFTFCG